MFACNGIDVDIGGFTSHWLGEGGKKVIKSNWTSCTVVIVNAMIFCSSSDCSIKVF